MEIWKTVSDNPNYEVSNTGRIRRVGASIDHSTRDCKGYRATDLYINGKRKKSRVHRLVAEAFIANPDNKLEVNHIDGNKYNNNVTNLEWVTKKENCRHAWDNGLIHPSYGMRGKHNPNGGRKGRPIRIKETGLIYKTLDECARAIDGNGGHINDCLRGRQKTHRGYHFEYYDK